MKSSSKITYQEDHRYVQKESDHGVGQQSEATDAGDILHAHLGHLDDDPCAEVNDGTGGRKVVERHERVHLEVAAAEEALDHDKADGFEDNATALEKEADQDEPDLAEGCDNDTDYDERDIAKRLQVRWCEAETPGSEEDSNGRSGLLIVNA